MLDQFVRAGLISCANGQRVRPGKEKRDCNEFHKCLDLQSGVSGIIFASRDVKLIGMLTPRKDMVR